MPCELLPNLPHSKFDNLAMSLYNTIDTTCLFAFGAFLLLLRLVVRMHLAKSKCTIIYSLDPMFTNSSLGVHAIYVKLCVV